MVFVGVYRAVYDYAPQDTNEIAISEGDLLCILEKGDDDWWKAKKKASSNEEDEPEGLVPFNYLEEIKPASTARALYEYTRQTDEELSFSEEASLEVYDTTDEDWTLVGLRGEYGFVPANYIELEEAPPPMPSRPQAPIPAAAARAPSPTPSDSPIESPAAALAGIIGSRTNGPAAASRSFPTPEALPPRKQVQFSAPDSEDDAPAPSLPRRPTSGQPAAEREIEVPQDRFDYTPREVRAQKQVSIQIPPTTRDEGLLRSPPYNRVVSGGYDDDRPVSSPGGFRMYNIYEVVEALGKNRKTPVTLGIHIGKGSIMISSGESKESKEWSADKLANYSIEGKHVFMELVRPSKSVDFHAGAKETAQEIVMALGDLAGAIKAEGITQELFAFGPGSQKLGKILYDFKASASDEVSVKTGDEVIVLDDTKSEEWWLVRRNKSGKEGMVPSSYVEVTGSITTAQTAGKSSKSNGKSSYVAQNRAEEERLAREASSRSMHQDSRDEVGPGLRLPERGSSLADEKRHSVSKSNRDTKDGSRGSSSKRPMPNTRKVRTWTDRTASFKVEAEFIGLKDGKIHLHKTNGVKIAVPVGKMSIEDLEYVEGATGQSLEDEKSLADIKRRKSQRKQEGGDSGATIDKKPEYDWFDFFLQCGVNPQICGRYTLAFRRDEIGEESLSDISPALLRTLGFKEGDILRVMKHLDAKFGRANGAMSAVEPASNGKLFTTDGGVLRNNRRPTPANRVGDVVDAKALNPQSTSQSKQTSPATAQAQTQLLGGFEDDAWNPRETRNPPQQEAVVSAPTSAPPTQNIMSTAAAELSGLSLSTPALQPTITAQLPPQPAPQPAVAAIPSQPEKPPGATPSLFEQLANSAANQQANAPRQRPQPPMQTQGQNSLIAPPPQRASSAPQNQQSAFQPPPLQPQLTGYPGQMQMHTQVAPPGQSLQEMSQQRNFQQQQQMMPQQTGYGQQFGGFGQVNNGMLPQQTGYGHMPQQGIGFGKFQPQQTGFQQPQQTGFQQQQPTGFNPMQQQFMNGQQMSSPFADQPTYQPLQPQQTGINAFLPPPLMPQQTGFGANGLTQQAPPMPPMPQQTPAPLVPQKTGPPPPVRFGVNPSAKKLTPQPTGKRANLSYATPDNPFGF